MAFVPMAEAVAGNPALAAEYNNVVRNARDLNARIGTAFTDVDTVSAWATATQSAIDALQNEAFGAAGRTTKPMVKLRLNAEQVFNYATDTMMNWQIEDFDTATMHTGIEQRITIPIAGKYLNVVTINLGADENGAGVRVPDRGSMGVKLLLNSTDPNPGPSIAAATATAPFNSAGEGPVVVMSAVNSFAAGDQIRVSGWHNFSAGDNTVVGNRLNMTVVPGPFEQVGTTWACIYQGK